MRRPGRSTHPGSTPARRPPGRAPAPVTDMDRPRVLVGHVERRARRRSRLGGGSPLLDLAVVDDRLARLVERREARLVQGALVADVDLAVDAARVGHLIGPARGGY